MFNNNQVISDSTEEKRLLWQQNGLPFSRQTNGIGFIEGRFISCQPP